MKVSLKIAILGATGYVGLELVKILSKHKNVSIKYLCATSSVGRSIKTFNKQLPTKLPKITNIKKINFKDLDVIFSALPNGEAQKIAKKIVGNTKLIDLSGDFRLKNHFDYKKWYGRQHKSKNLIKSSIYALTEFCRKHIKNYKIISCPGCYPTSILIPLIPLIKNKKINEKNIVIDSKSGFSGAGKKIKKIFPQNVLYNTISAYGLGKHKHMPEIEQELSLVSKNKIKVSFTPHLMPMFRGIISTIYIDLKKNITPKYIYNFLKKTHKNNLFIKFKKYNESFNTGEVINTNFCKLSVYPDRRNNKAIVVSAIDNLVKGASGQAVQNMNVIYNIDESRGLL